IHALWPYRVVRPGDPDKHNKYVFEKRVAPRFTQPRFFRLGNYYSSIADNALNGNPLLVRNPFHQSNTKMSRQILYRLLLFSVVLFGGCELDNYDPPASPLTGRLVFDG